MDDISEQIYDFVYSAQYKKAFLVARKAFECFPQNRFAQYHFAVCLGDCGEWTDEKTEIKNAKKAARILKQLLLKSRGVDPRWRKSWRNEYYWFSKQPYKQWKLGKQQVNSGFPTAAYSMGVGAVSLSIEFVGKGNAARAIAWAKRAETAWLAYFRRVNDYYNAYVWYAKSLGLQGKIAEMDKALKVAAKLSKRSISYSEFVEARAISITAWRRIEHRKKRPSSKLNGMQKK